MSKIVFLMNVHNGERFIRQSIGSVLKQTERDISLIIRNNGSSDGSGDIIREFSNKDSRVCVLENKENYKTDDGYGPLDRKWWPEFDGEYVSIIDHDDILDFNFAHDMYKAAKEKGADMVICGCNFFEDESNKVVGQRLSPAVSVTDLKLLEPYFPQLYGNLRTQWGILYRVEFYERYYSYARQNPEELKLSVDTWRVLRYLEKCKSFVNLEDALYFYRIRRNSQFNTQSLEKYRIHEADILFEYGMKCINNLGISTSQNQFCLCQVHLGHMVDLLHLLSGSYTMSVKDKLSYIQEILANKRMNTYITSHPTPMFNLILKEICDCIGFIVPELSIIDAELWNFYILRIYDSYIHMKCGNTGLNYAMLLGALLDTENIYHFGMQLLKDNGYTNLSIAETYFSNLPVETQLQCLNEKSRFAEMLNIPLNGGNVQEIQDEIVKLAEAQIFGKATDLLQQLCRLNMVDEYAMYYRLYLSVLIGEIDFARKLSYTARNIWTNSDEVTELCDYVCSIPREEKILNQFTPELVNSILGESDDFDKFCNLISTYTLQSLLNLSYAQYCLRPEKNETNKMDQADEFAAVRYTKSVHIGCFITLVKGGATIYNAVQDMKKNIRCYQTVYEKLSDLKSRETFRDIMLYRFYGDLRYLTRCHTTEEQYYLPYILPARNDAVYVDCGAFNGRTVLDYINIYGSDYKKIYVYEPVPDNCKTIREALKNCPRISIMNKGVSSASGTMRFTAHMPSSANRLNPQGELCIPVSTLDIDITETITFIKMDVEGAEQQAIAGSTVHIQNDRPELAICVYHLVEDLWKIPQMLLDINPHQKLYLRYHLDGSVPEEIVLYASPTGGEKNVI